MSSKYPCQKVNPNSPCFVFKNSRRRPLQQEVQNFAVCGTQSLWFMAWKESWRVSTTMKTQQWSHSKDPAPQITRGAKNHKLRRASAEQEATPVDERKLIVEQGKNHKDAPVTSTQMHKRPIAVLQRKERTMLGSRSWNCIATLQWCIQMVLQRDYRACIWLPSGTLWPLETHEYV